MKSVTKKSVKKSAFTIVELLTVMSIIVILIGLLVPALNHVRKYAKEVKQRAQFHAINVALEFFNGEFEGYPSSSATGTEPDGTEDAYCGAMKLAEAMVGKDLMGVHPDTVFNSSGEDYNSNQLYTAATMNSRKGPYLPIENANAYRMDEIYPSVNPFLPGNIVLCDVFGQVTNRSTGAKIGMPILYYKANTSRISHTVNNPGNSIFNYLDNQELLLLGKPWEQNNPTENVHNLAKEGTFPDGARFYENTRNYQVTNVTMPFNKDTYILISAGYDGEYGTSDDICNFDFKYRELTTN